MCHVLVTVFSPLYRSLSKRVPVGRVREHHTQPTRFSSKNYSHLQREKRVQSGREVVAFSSLTGKIGKRDQMSDDSNNGITLSFKQGTQIVETKHKRKIKLCSETVQTCVISELMLGLFSMG